MLRSVLAVLAGFVSMAAVVMAGTAAATAAFIPGGVGAAMRSAPASLPSSYLAANLIASAAGAVLGGWLTARLAPGRPLAHTAALAVLMLAMAIPTVLRGDPTGAQPAWYGATVALLGIAGAFTGGMLRTRWWPVHAEEGPARGAP